MKSYIYAVLVLSMVGGFAAEAKSKKSSFEATSPGTSVAIPSAHLILTPAVTETPQVSWFGAGINTYAPTNLNLPSRFSNASAYSRNTIPGLYLNYSRPMIGRDFNLKVGASWIGMSRTATLVNTGYSTQQTQEVNFAAFRLGVEYAPEKFAGKIFAPYASASILPTFALATRSSFDDGSTYFGLPVEAALGTRIKCNAIGIPLDNADFDVAATAVGGTMKGSTMGGFGVSAGMRVGL